MLTSAQFSSLYEEVGSAPTLSVYLGGGVADGFDRATPAKVLHAELDRARADLMMKEPDADLSAFGDAAILATSALGKSKPGSLAGGWMAVVSRGTVLHEEVPPVPLASKVRWKPGLLVAPYLPVLEWTEPISMAVGDQWSARILRFEAGALHEGAPIVEERVLDDLSNMGVMKAASTTSGVRGATGRDTAERSFRDGRRHLFRSVESALGDVMAPGEWVVLGGTAEVASGIRSYLPPGACERCVVATGIRLDMTVSEVMHAAAPAFAEVRDRRHRSMLEFITESTHTGGRGALGWNRALEAVLRSAVDTLMLSRRFAEERVADAERLIEAVLATGGRVASPEGETGAQLDRLGGGVGARLRF